MIYAVGVGPGDPGLITLKALEVLRGCDCVYAFKWAGRVLEAHGVNYVELKYGPHMRQIAEAARRCEKLCVAFTGDPAVSEWEMISPMAGLGPLEMVPGVSSILAAFSVLKMPFDKVIFASLHRSDASLEDLEAVAEALRRGYAAVILPRPWDIMLPEIARYLRQRVGDCRAIVVERVGVDNAVREIKLSEADGVRTSDMSIYVVTC